MSTPFPVPLENLIAYVRSLAPQHDPLDELSEAIVVSQRLDEQSDALLGYFVNQARRSGASWSQIGTSMGVTKQAAQKRFVPRWDGSDPIPGGQLFSRFTARARHVLATAVSIAAGSETTDGAIVAGLFSEPEGLAAVILNRLGATEDAVMAALGLAPVETRADSSATTLQEFPFAPEAKKLLEGALKAALRLGHNYIGTEHLLLGALTADGPAATALQRLGVTAAAVEAGVTEEIARVIATRRGGTES